MRCKRVTFWKNPTLFYLGGNEAGVFFYFIGEVGVVVKAIIPGNAKEVFIILVFFYFFQYGSAAHKIDKCFGRHPQVCNKVSFQLPISKVMPLA